MLWGPKGLSARPAPCLLSHASVLPWCASVSLLRWTRPLPGARLWSCVSAEAFPWGRRGPERLDGPGDGLAPRAPSVLGAADPPQLC